MYSEGNQQLALELLENTKNGYLEALEGYELHPYLDTFYQQIGNICIHLRMFDRACDNYEKLIDLKELQYGANSHHLSENLMQLQTASLGTDDVQLNLKRALRAHTVHVAIIKKLNDELRPAFH